MSKFGAYLLVLALLTLLPAACTPKPKATPKPDLYPAGTKVVLKMWMYPPEPFQLELGPRSSQLFLAMLAKLPVHSEISRMPAESMGSFIVGDAKYYWHGNGVIRGEGDDERLWHGPFLQALINDVTNDKAESREPIQRILDRLENDPSVPNTPLEGPGAYPGGGDALHPVDLHDPTGWRVFTPSTTKP